jgi:hypothetical protein
MRYIERGSTYTQGYHLIFLYIYNLLKVLFGTRKKIGSGVGHIAPLGFGAICSYRFHGKYQKVLTCKRFVFNVYMF